jgi:hypothetical protein
MTLTSDILNVSPLEVIRQAVEKEQRYTGRRFLIVWRYRRDGSFGLHVVHPQRNLTLYTLGPQIMDATIENSRHANMATAVVAVGTTKKGKNGKRVTYKHREVAAELVAKFGYIEKRYRVKGNVDGRAEVVKEAKAYLAEHVKQVRKLTGLQHPGIAFLRRGDTVQVELPEHHITGKHGTMWVTSVTHRLVPGEYTMTIDFQSRDPLDPATLKKERDAALRARKRAAKGKK